jgi:hypothetical protein
MTAFTRSELELEGFTGFVSFQAILADRSVVPAERGIYVVLTDKREPGFLKKSTGGRFKGRDPSVPAEMLTSKWVPEASVLYLGKANDLRRRLHDFARFGNGRQVGHWGGRLLWHLEAASGLLVGWKTTPDMDSRQVEKEYLHLFEAQHGGKLPFANLVP